MSFRKLTMAAVAAVSLSVAAAPADANTILIMGQAGGPLFTSTFNAAGGGGAGSTTLSVTNGTVNITELGGIPGSTPAFFNFTTTNTAAAVTVSTTVLQEFGGGSFTVTSGMNGTGVNYLSGTFSVATFSGSGSSGGVVSSTFAGSIIGLTSDVLGSLEAPFGMSFSFTNITPPLGITGGGGTAFNTCGSLPTLCDFTASYSGEFSAEQFSIPVPASLALFGLGLVALGAAVRRKAA